MVEREDFQIESVELDSSVEEAALRTLKEAALLARRKVEESAFLARKKVEESAALARKKAAAAAEAAEAELRKVEKAAVLAIQQVEMESALALLTVEKAAEVLRTSNEELNLRIKGRNAQLKAAMQEQESFSYSVSHDLRAPLRHINSYSSILEEDCGECLTPEARGYLKHIRASSLSMGNLIDDLLRLSQIGRSVLQKTVVNLTELASAISCNLQELEPERDVEFVLAPDQEVHGDQGLLVQVLENLLGNAWKYTGRRESSRIELGRVQIGDQEVNFVRDNGIGFDMAYKDKLFGAFQRLHGAEFEGNGIGLATVKRIVERHGGTVWAESAVNEGTTIYFTLC